MDRKLDKFYFFFPTSTKKKCAEKYETSLIETPGSSKTPGKCSGGGTTISPLVCEAKRCINFDEEPPCKEQLTQVEEEEDDENNLEENLKYIQVLKRYFGYSKFRK